ncbi:MAG: FecR domain-containing protein [Myxococcales bacterium]|jgi:ferric-dicitrate binding protein FerR (iron transport regulator)
MACEERKSLWSHVAGELSPTEREHIEAHLEACSECRAECEAIRATREVLALASPVAPPVDWQRADDQVTTAAARRMARLEPRWWPFSLQWGLGLAAAACIALFVVVDRAPPSSVELPVAEAPAATPAIAESVVGARIDGATAALAEGEAIGAGATVSTPDDGRAVLGLPEGSRVRVAESSRMRLARLATDEVRLEIEKGRVAIKAAHVERKAFVVEAAGVAVRVVGTAFTVSLGAGELEVAVAEGVVALERGEGLQTFVRAGERVLVNPEDGSVKSFGLTPRVADDLGALGVDVAVAAPARPKVAASSPAPAQPAVAAPAAGAAPVVAPPSVAPSSVAAVEPPPAPSGPVAPAPRAPVLEARPAARPPAQEIRHPASITVEEQLLNEAEFAASRGECARYQLFLAEYLEDTSAPAGREKARWLRAQCFEKMAMPVDADAEYRRYLREFPDGPHAEEARRAIAH